MIAAVLAAAFVMMMTAAAAYAAGPETEKVVTGLGVTPMNDPRTGDGGWCKVYYGNAGTPLRFKVLNTHETDFGSETLFIDCDSIISRDFAALWWDYHWQGSQLQGATYFDTKYRLTDAEFGAVHQSTKSEPDIEGGDIFPVYDPQGILDYEFEGIKVERFFVLDTAEAMNVHYGFPPNRNKTSLRQKSGNGGDYWLRSKSGHWSQADSIALVNSNGSMSKKYGGNRGSSRNPEYESGISPAMNIPLEKILFTTLVNGVAGYAGAEYKLTILDNSPYPQYLGDLGLEARVGQVLRHGNEVTVPFSVSGKRIANATQISYLVTDKKWNEEGAKILKYGKLDIVSGNVTSEGVGTFELPEGCEEENGAGYHAYIFVEDVNEGKLTDYASEPLELVKLPPITIKAAAEPYEGVYDGKAHSIELSVNPVYADIKYGTSEGVYDLDECPSYTGAGDYPIYYQITCDGYETVEGSTYISIAPRASKVSGIEVKDRIYDGTAVVEIDMEHEPELTNIVPGEEITITGEGVLPDANIGKDKPVQLQYVLSGETAANYVIDPESQTTASASVSKREVTVSGIKAFDKVVDDWWTAELDFEEVVIHNKIEGDDLFITAFANFNDPGLLNELQTVHINGLTLIGNDVGNYVLAKEGQQTRTQARILPRGELIVNVSDKTHVYDGQPHTITVTATDTTEDFDPDKVTIRYRSSESDKWGGPVYATDAGTTTVYYQVVDMNLMVSDPFEGEATLTITPKPVTVSGAGRLTKPYDGTTAAPSDYDVRTAEIGGKVDGDDIIVSGGSAVYTDAGVGGSKTVLLSGLTLGGAKASNYTLEPSAAVTGEITRRPVAVSGVSASDKVYDGTTDAELSADDIKIENVIDGEEVAAAASGSFENADAGNSKTVNISYELSGKDAGNYYVDTTDSRTQNTASAAIHKKAITTTVNSVDTVYDGKKHSAVVSVEGGIEADIKYGETEGGCTLTEAPEFTDAGYYVVCYEVTPKSGNYYGDSGMLSVSIRPRGLAVKDVKAKDKVYDGTAHAEVSAASLDGLVSGDDITVTAEGSFRDVKAGEDRQVDITRYDLSGESAGNYFLDEEGSLDTSSANITRRPVTVSGIKARDKIIDENNTAELDLDDVVIENVVKGDELSVTARGEFSDAAYTLSPQPVYIRDLTLTGKDADNYVLAEEGQQTEAQASIYPMDMPDITVSGKTHVYDGQPHTITVTVTDKVDGADPDKVSIGYSLFPGSTVWSQDPPVFTDVTETTIYYFVTDNNIKGINMFSGSATLRITPKRAAVSSADISKVYDGTTKAPEDIDLSTAVIEGKAGSDDISVTDGTAVFDDPGAGERTVFLSGLTLGGSKAGNYILEQEAQVKGTITKRPLTVSGVTVSDKVYDGSTEASVHSNAVKLENLVAGDDVKVTASGSFADARAGEDKQVDLTYAVSGPDADNYYIDTESSQKSASASISRKPVTASGIGAFDKTVDGSADAELDFDDAVIHGVIVGDEVFLTGAGEFRNAGYTLGRQPVTITDLVLTGKDAGNYVLSDVGQQTGTQASILPADRPLITVSGKRHVYDGEPHTFTVTVTDTVEDADPEKVSIGYSLKPGLDNEWSSDPIYMTDVSETPIYFLISDDNLLSDNKLYSSATLRITPRPISVSGIEALGKVYDGNTDAELDLSGMKIENAVEGDDVSVTVTGGFDNAAAGEGRKVVLSYELTGEDAANYYIDTDHSQKTASADISGKKLTIKETPVDAVYDGKEHSASVSVEDDVDVNIKYGESEGRFILVDSPAYRNAGARKVYYQVTPNDPSYEDAEGALDVKISPRKLVVTGVAAKDKVYDGTTDAELDLSGMKIENAVEGDDVAASVTGSFDDAAAGEGKTVSLSYELSGKDAANYVIDTDNSQKTASAAITGKDEEKEDEEEKVISYKGVLLAKVKAKGSRRLVITWNRIKGADGYDVYFARCKSSGKAAKFKKVKTVKAGRKLSLTRKKLKKRTAYAAYVRAYVMKDGSKSYIKKSLKIFAFTSGGTKRYTNAGRVTVRKASISLKRGKKYKIRAGVIKLQKKKKLMPRKYVPKLRYVTSDAKVAKVNKYGRITAAAKGKCKVYAVSAGGAYKAVTVTVK